MIVATRHVPPFAIRGDDGTWSGISIDLWNAIATELGVTTDFRETDLDEMIRGTADGRYDAAVAALTMTSEREKQVDFSHPFYNSGLGIAVPGATASGWKRLLGRLISIEFVQVVAALALLLFGLGLLVWLFERRRNPEQFGHGVSRGIGSGFWWSAVTMTTVGYGDKAPVTIGGRIVALVWMFGSIIIISSFTAAIASALTVSQLESGIQGPEDLPGARVGTVRGATSEAYLRGRRAKVRTYDSPADALAALGAGKVEAVVYDEPVLRYLVNNESTALLRVLPRTFEPQNYAIALPHGSPHRENINRMILERTSEAAWQDTLYRYLGG
jgi:ABC-type amino acid transport substrate-binding protein